MEFEGALEELSIVILNKVGRWVGHRALARPVIHLQFYKEL